MKNKRVIAALSSVLLLISAAPNVWAAEWKPVYISTAAVPEEADDYAEEMFSSISTGDLTYLGFSKSEAKSAELCEGFIAENLSENVNKDSDFQVFYYPVVCDGNITAMMTVSLNDGKYGWQFGKTKMCKTLNELETSPDNAAAIYVSENAFYAAAGDEVTLLSETLPYSLKDIEEEKTAIKDRYASDSKKRDIITVYGDSYVEIKNINGRIYAVKPDGSYAVGWQASDGNIFYFRKNAEAAVKNTTIGGVRYKFSSEGVCEGKYTGWVKRSGKYYYYKNGEMLKNKWLKVKGKNTYYLSADGSRAVGETEISGKTYTFDENGKVK